MDDTWGSPWTSTEQSFPNFHDQNLHHESPKPPQPAVLSRNSLANLPSLSFSSLAEDSPWANDNDDAGDNSFGDWATAANPISKFHGINPTGTSPGGWGGSTLTHDGFDNTNRLSPRPREKSLSAASTSLMYWANPNTNSSVLSLSLSPAASPAASRSPSPMRSAALRSRASSILSRSSTDPWSSTVPAKPEPTLELKSNSTITPTQNISRDIPILQLNHSDLHGNQQTVKQAADKSAIAETASELDDEEDDDASSFPSFEDAGTDVAGDGEETNPGKYGSKMEIQAKGVRECVVGTDADANAGAEKETSAPGVSRPTTSGSDNSHDAQAQQDSPTTSIEEVDDGAACGAGECDDPGTHQRPLYLQEQSSSKVQGLVELFDGLSSRSVSISRSVDTGQQETRSDTGEEEERTATENSLAVPDSAALDSTVTATIKMPTALPASKTGSLEREPSTQSEIMVEDVAKDGSPAKEARPATLPVSVAGLLKAYGHQRYSIDNDKIDVLFKEDVPKTLRSEEPHPNIYADDGYVPDHVLVDSFTAISERKAWYRISRQGSYRKHNAGGDDNENYRPVTWATSTVRLDTVKIVRRWMEEDSFTGKPTLGGAGGVRGNMFGWDSAAEPVALDKIFKRPATKRLYKGVHKPSASVSSVSPWEDVDNESHGASRASRGHGNSLPAADFGWGSESTNCSPSEPVRHSIQLGGSNVWATPAQPTETTQAASANVKSGRLALDPPRSSTDGFALLPPKVMAVRPVENASPPTISATGTTEATDDDDDDEWGEMITSPVVGGCESLPLETTLTPTLLPTRAPAPTQEPLPLATGNLFGDVPTSALIDDIVNALPDLSYMSY